MRAIVGDLIDLSALQAGRFRLNPGSTDLLLCLHEAMQARLCLLLLSLPSCPHSTPLVGEPGSIPQLIADAREQVGTLYQSMRSIMSQFYASAGHLGG